MCKVDVHATSQQYTAYLEVALARVSGGRPPTRNATVRQAPASAPFLAVSPFRMQQVSVGRAETESTAADPGSKALPRPGSTLAAIPSHLGPSCDVSIPRLERQERAKEGLCR